MPPGRYAVPALLAGLLVQGCALSVRQEVDLGQRYAAQLEQELPILHLPPIQADLDLIAGRLTPFTRRREIAYRFYVVNSAVVNAFAVPGGYVYVTRGLIEHAQSMDQLAGVVAHEIGHIELRHSAEQIGRAQAAEAGVGIATVLLGRRPSEAAQVGASLAQQLLFAKFSRDQEREADRAAVDYMTGARVDPGGLVRMFETMRSLERARPSLLESFFRSHPMTDERIANVTALIAANAAATALQGTGERDAPEFQRLRRALASLPPPADRQP